MGWLANLLNARAALPQGGLAGGDGRGFSGLFPAGRSNPPSRGTAGFLRAYSTMPWLRAVTSRVATAVASVPWRVLTVQRDGRAVRHRALQVGNPQERRAISAGLRQAGELVDLEEHPLLDLLNDPNPILEGLEARKLTQLYLDIAGETFWVLDRNRLDMPVHAWPLPPSWVRATPGADEPFFEVALPGWQGAIPERDVVWFKDPDPTNPYSGRGSGLARALADELETDEYAAKHTKSFFFNSARPDLLITADEATEAEVKRIQDRWLGQSQGFWRSFKPFFTNRKLDVKEIGQSFADMQLLGLRKQERDTIIEVFGVPPEILGIIESSNRATIAAADFLFSRWVVVPRLEKIRSVLQERLVPEFDERLVVDYVSPVQEDREHLLAVAKAAPWSLSVDEWRELGEREPLPDDGGEIFMVPFNLIPSESISGAGAEGPAQPPSGADEGGDERAAGPPVRRTHLLTPAADERLRAIHRAADRVAAEMAAAYERTVDGHRERIDLGALEAALASQNAGAAEEASGLSELAAALWGTFAPRRQFEDAGGSMLRFIGASLELGGEIAADDLGERAEIAIEFDAANPAAVSWARSHAAEMVTAVSGQTRDAVRDAIVRAIEDRLPPQTAAREIRDLIGLTRRDAAAVQRLRERLLEEGAGEQAAEDQVARASRRALNRRALTIARQETLLAANAGQDFLWEQAVRDGLLDPEATMREWLTAEDERVDDELCAPMMGRRAKIGEPFDTPIGPFDRPPQHVLCRCTPILVFEERQ